MTFAYQILIHTPLWVLALFAYLVWQGIKAMQPRDDADLARADRAGRVHRLGHFAARLRHQDSVWPLVAWIAAALVLLPLGVLTPRPFDVDHTTGEIIRPGSVFALIRNLIVFALQYTVG